VPSAFASSSTRPNSRYSSGVRNRSRRVSLTGISLIELGELFPNEDAAREWFEAKRWPDEERPCPRCVDGVGRPVPNENRMPYRCVRCHKFFSVRTGTALERSKVPLKKWAYAIYLSVTSLKGVSSMKLHRDIGVTQKTAWFMAHRIREAWGLDDYAPPFAGPVEVDETYMGGEEKNRHASKKMHISGPSDKVAVVGIKDCETNEVAAKPVASTDGPTLKGFVRENAAKGAEIFTDDHAAYHGLPQHTAVNDSVGEYVGWRTRTESRASGQC